MVGYCCICKVGAGEEKNVSIHRLPKDENIKASWFAFIGHEISVHSGVCSKHFKQSDFLYKMYGDSYRRFLKPGVCPSILDGSSNNRTNVKLSENINNSWRIERDSDKNIIIKQEPEECMLLDNINETVINMENSIDLQFKSETDDSLIFMKHNTNLETSTILKNEVREFVNIETISTNSVDNQLKREIEDPLAITKHDINLKTNIILRNRIKKSININDTFNRNSRYNQLKRKRTNSLVSNRRFYNTRYIGDLCRYDFTSDGSWNLFKNHLVNTKEKIRSLTNKIVSLNRKIDRLQNKKNHF